MDLIRFKIIAFITIFLTGVYGGFFAQYLAGGKRSEFYFSCGNSFAGGIFLYIALIDILNEEFSASTSHLLFKFILVLAGFGIMALVAIWT